MNRRQFIKRSTMACAAVALLPGSLPAQAEKSAAPAYSGASGTGKVPDYAKDMLHSDMDGIGPDGKPTGQKATYTGASKANAKAEKAMRHKMKLTREEQAILDGVDVLNFSIGGGSSPYSDIVSLAFFSAFENDVFVACSAGNSGPGPDTVGHRERLQQVDSRIQELPGLFLTGNSYRGVALNDCTQNAVRVAETVCEYLAAKP